MAERRMFAKSIVLSDSFLDMPMSARCLYFTMGMLADDDGFVGSPKAIMRQCGATDDDMKILLAKRYVLGFESGIIVIKHWRMNNYLQNDRHKATTYLEELASLSIDEKGAYTNKNISCIQNVYTGKVSIDKYSIDKINIKNNDNNEAADNIFDIYQNEIGTLSTRQFEKLNKILDKLDESLIREAIYRTSDANVKSFKYFETIANDWINKGYKSVGDIITPTKKGKRVIDLPDWEEQIKKDKEVSLITDEDRKEFGID